MGAPYDKLWHLLIDRHMSKTQLIKEAHISTNAMAHIGKNEDVRVEVLVKICNALKYSLQGTTQGRYLTGGVPPVRFSM